MAVVWFFAILRKKQQQKRVTVFRANMSAVYGRQDAWLKSFWWLITRIYILSQWQKRWGGARQAKGWCAYWRLWFVADKLVVKEGSDCCVERGFVGITKGDGGTVPGRSWCYDEGSLGSSHLAGVLVAEEQLCRRFHIPGFWRQGRYYCIL